MSGKFFIIKLKIEEINVKNIKYIEIHYYSRLTVVQMQEVYLIFCYKLLCFLIYSKKLYINIINNN